MAPEFYPLEVCHMEEQKQFITLEMILSKDAEELSPVSLGEFHIPRLGATIPFASLTAEEQKQARKDCRSTVRQGKQLVPQVDDEKMMMKLIVQAVDKDKRSTFSFANKALMEHLTKVNEAQGLKPVLTAEQAVAAMLKPGEITDFAVAIQDLCGFGPENGEEIAEQVKNS